MNTAVENITFIVVRGIVALAIVGVGFYCIGQGIHFLALPRVEADQIHIHFFGLDITATGLGAVIFGTGLALCFVGKRTAPTRIETTRTTETLATQGTATQPATSTVLPAEASSETPAIQGTTTQPVTSAGPPATPSSSSVRTTEGVAIAEGTRTPPVRFD